MKQAITMLAVGTLAFSSLAFSAPTRADDCAAIEGQYVPGRNHNQDRCVVAGEISTVPSGQPAVTYGEPTPVGAPTRVVTVTGAPQKVGNGKSANTTQTIDIETTQPTEVVRTTTQPTVEVQATDVYDWVSNGANAGDLRRKADESGTVELGPGTPSVTTMTVDGDPIITNTSGTCMNNQGKGDRDNACPTS